MKTKYNFAVMIFCWGRPEFDNTIKTLRKCGYTGKIICLLDNLDKTRHEYVNKYGEDNCYIFDKKEVAKRTDMMNNFGKLESTVLVSNIIFEAAKHFNLDYFAAMCDDYLCFSHKREKERRTRKLDEVIEAFVDFLAETRSVSCIAMAQGGDYATADKPMCKRKVMNSFICATDRPFKYCGAMNDDVNMYVYNGIRGKIYLTYNRFILHQPPTQIIEGGLSEVYKKYGTFVKSFYSVMLWPSGVKVALIGNRHIRIHHRIDYSRTVPYIIRQNWKKQ